MINTKARAETIRYHEGYYSKHSLFEKGSWLEKPDQLSLDVLSKLSQPSPLILDLGAGVGRNAIAIAKEIAAINGKVTAVDFLPTAVNKLRENIENHQLQNYVQAIEADFENFAIAANSYDFILAVSVLEHSSTLPNMLKVLDNIIAGTKINGFNRLEFTTNRNVRDNKTGEGITTLVETPLTSDFLVETLKAKYANWNILHMELIPYKEVLEKDGREILWQSTQLNLIALKLS